MPVALITGAGRGLGAAFARRLARDGHDLVLVGRHPAALDGVATAARATGVAAEVLVADLTEPADRAAVQRRLADPDRPVDLLVNNASSGAGVDFLTAGAAALQAEIDVNVTAVLQLTHAALPGMITRGRGGVLNVASFSGYLPAAGSAYAATKAWMLALTDTVEPLLAGTGVHLTAVVPGRMLTGKHPGLEPGAPTLMWLDPDAVVDTCLADLARGRPLSTPGPLYRTVVGVLELPRRTLRRAARLAGRDRARHRHGAEITPVAPPR